MTVMDGGGVVGGESDILGHIDYLVLVDEVTFERDAEGRGHEERTEDC